MLATATTWGRSIMAELNDRAQQARIDARALWVPITVVIAIIAAAATAGGWIVSVNSKVGMVATQTTQLSEIKGSLETLTRMQDTVSQTAAELSGLRSRIDSQNTVIQTQNAWIMTTRERLKDKGFETPEFNPPPLK